MCPQGGGVFELSPPPSVSRGCREIMNEAVFRVGVLTLPRDGSSNSWWRGMMAFAYLTVSFDCNFAHKHSEYAKKISRPAALTEAT